MRRMRQAEKRDYTLKKASAAKNSEGNSYTQWGNGTTIQAIIRHASRALDTAAYGQHVLDVLKMQYEGTESITEGDGICVFVDAQSDPDYRVTSKKGLTEDTFRVFTLEAI